MVAGFTEPPEKREGIEILGAGAIKAHATPKSVGRIVGIS
jgi:hypothetical protein